MIIGATLLVLLIIVHIASKETEEKPTRVYICHKNHVFTEPVKQKVLDYDGFVEEIDACPICNSDVKLHKE